MVVFSQMKNITAISFVLASTASGMKQSNFRDNDQRDQDYAAQLVGLDRHAAKRATSGSGVVKVLGRSNPESLPGLPSASASSPGCESENVIDDAAARASIKNEWKSQEPYIYKTKDGKVKQTPTFLDSKSNEEASEHKSEEEKVERTNGESNPQSNEETNAPTPIKKLAIAAGVAGLTGCAAGAMAIPRAERNETELFEDLASLDSDLGTAGEEPPQGLNIDVMTRAEAEENGIDTGLIPERTDANASIDAHIFYAPNDTDNQNIANDLQEVLVSQEIFDDLQVNELADYDFGDADIVVVRDIDPTSSGQTALMIGLIALGVLSLLFVMLKFTEEKLDGVPVNKLGLGIILTGLGVGASISAGCGLHFLSGDTMENVAEMAGCTLGFLASVALMVFVFNVTRKAPIFRDIEAVVKHVMGAAALVGGCAILTNLAGEAFGETIVAQIKETVTDEVVDVTGLGWMDVVFSGPLLLVGFWWFFCTFFQNANHVNGDYGIARTNWFVLGVGAFITTATVLGGAHLIAKHDLAGIACFAIAAIIMGALLMFVRHEGFRKVMLCKRK